MRAKVRLYVDAPLGEGQEVGFDRAQANYLFCVMRLGVGAFVALFNGRDGEWTAEIVRAGKRAGAALCLEQAVAQVAASDVWLLFAPVKKVRTAYIVEKATELGVARLQPVFTAFGNAERVRVERMQAQAVEAAEQSGRVCVPLVMAPEKLETVLQGWSGDRRIMFCDERMQAATVCEALVADGPGSWAVLVGPEGGFSPDEAAQLRAMEQVVPVMLGPRILRAETAAVAALVLWQSVLGDWR